MPRPLDHIAFLSQEVGPRPAGTEEEQQAALYITEQMQKEAGLSAVIEDFSSQSGAELPRVICVLISFVFALAATIFPIVGIPAIILSAIAAALYVMETLNKPVISKLFSRGVSQNVVARYEPSSVSSGGSSRRRKIVVVANYDSGKVRSELKGSFVGVYSILQRVVLGAMIFVPLFLLIRQVFFLNTEGGTAIALNVVTGIALVIVILPAILALVHKIAPYNEGANNNASGIAVLLELARRVGRDSFPTGEASSSAGMLDESAPTIHGEEAARSAGLIPEGVRLVYEAAQVEPPAPNPQSEEERVTAANAAIAALTGKPVPHKENRSVADHLVQVKEPPLEMPDDQEVKELREETREAFTTIPAETLQQAQENVAEEVPPGVTGEITFNSQSDMAAAVAPDMTDSAPAPSSLPSAPTPGMSSGVPDWYIKAQENAKKPKSAAQPKVQRSRYAEALDAAVAESSSHFSRANKAVDFETEERLRKMREGIREVSAPQQERAALGQQYPDGSGFPQEGEQASDPTFAQQQGSGDSAHNHHEPHASQRMRPSQGSSQGGAGVAALFPSSDQAVDGGTTAMQPIDVNELRSSLGDRQPSSPQGDVDAQEAAPQAPEPLVQMAVPEVEQRRPIVLPDIGVSTSNLAPIDTSKQQRAPLAVAEESSQGAAKSLLNMLPSIDIGEEPAEEQEGEAAADTAESRNALKSTLPSLSGALPRTTPTGEASSPSSTGSINIAGSFASAGATGTFSPVGDELLQDVDPEDIYVDDADDSVFEGSMTETGAFAGPGYVEMPKSRVRRFMDKFSRKKNDDDQVSAKEWLDVDDDFDARTVGAERGGWESFQSDGSEPLYSDEGYSELGDGEVEPSQRKRSDDQWEGGAFSRRRMSVYDDDEPEQNSEATTSSRYDAPQAAVDRPTDGVSEYAAGSSHDYEMNEIQQFRQGAFTTEIWFVALGSTLANNGGMRAFLEANEQDLRGSIFINLESLGAGDLSYIEKEGFTGKAKMSSRLRRYLKKATQNTGVQLDSASLPWRSSPASLAAERGYQSMTIVGMDGKKPALLAQEDDVLDSIEEELLQVNTDFVMDLIKNI